MIAIIKYKAGNTASVAHALDRLNAEYFFAETPEELESAEAVIFPGVGHASSAMESLREKGVDVWLKNTQKLVLGICVGMQLFFESSSEGETQGLGVIPGRLQKFDETQDKVPHMGWNRIEIDKEHPILKNVLPENYLYFVHSYYATVSTYTLASCTYIHRFSAIVAKDNYIGVQFHPEKSGKIGSLILQNFLNLAGSSK